MITHKRAWAIRAGVVAVLAASGLFGIAAPALAADPNVTVTSLSSGSLNAGESATLKFKVKNNNPASDPGSTSIKVTFPGFSGSDVTCTGNCNFVQAIPGGQTSPEFTATIKAGSIAAGQTKNGKIHIAATINGTDNGAAPDSDLSITGPAQQSQGSVPEVSGTVVNIFDNTPIEAATVAIQDSASPPHTYQTGTDKSGNFKFTSSADKPIVPGTIAFQVDKTGITQFTTTKQAFANQGLVTVRLTVTPLASPGASATAVVPTIGGGPTTANPENTDSGTNVNTGSGGGGLSWVLIAIGAVLVLLGIGAIVLLFVRRNNDTGDDEDDGRGGPRKGGPRGGQPPGGRGGPPGPGRPGPGPRPGPGGGRGGPGYDPTRQMRPPVAPGPRADQTMIAPSPLAGAPTQVHGRPGVDPGRPNGYGPGQYGGGQGGGGQGGGGGYGQQPPNYGGQANAYPGGYGQPADPYGPPGYGQPPPAPDPYAPPPPYGQPDPRTPRPGNPPDGRRVDWLED